MNNSSVLSYNETFLQKIRSQGLILGSLFLLPVILSFFNDPWIFTPVGWLDPWMYVGAGNTFDDSAFGGLLKGGNYKLGRILWIYLQYIARHLFSSEIAPYVLQYFCIWIGVFSIYFTIKRMLGIIPACIGALLLCIYDPFLGSGGGDYHNALAGPLYALSFLTLTIAAQSTQHTVRWLLLFGGVYGLVLHTTVLYINFAPLLLFHCYTTRKIAQLQPLIWKHVFSSVFLGIVLSTILCGLLSRAYGYQFLFFLPQWHLASLFLYGEWTLSPWWRPWDSGWLFQAYWVAPLAAMMVACVAALWISFKTKVKTTTHMFARSLILQFLFIGSLWLIWQILHKDTLNTAYFTHPLIIPFILAVSASISFRSSPNRYLPLIFGGTALITCLNKHGLIFLKTYLLQAPFLSTFYLFTGILLILFFWTRLHTIGITALAVISISLGCYREHAYNLRDTALAIVKASEWIYHTYGQKGIPNRITRVFTWFDEHSAQDSNCPLSWIGASLTCTGFDYIHQPFPMPRIEDLTLADVKTRLSTTKSKMVVAITENRAQAEELQKRLAEMGFAFTISHFQEVRVNTVHIPLYILTDVSSNNRNHPNFDRQPPSSTFDNTISVGETISEEIQHIQ